MTPPTPSSLSDARVAAIADFLDSYARDEGGFSEDTRATIHADAEFLRAYAARSRDTSRDSECLAEHDGYVCTLPPGHDGDHKAYKVEFCTSWPVASTPQESTTND